MSPTSTVADDHNNNSDVGRHDKLSANGSGDADDKSVWSDFRSFAGIDTVATHAGLQPNDWRGRPIITPVVMSTTYLQTAAGVHDGWDYTRAGNPTKDALETCLAALEQARYCTAFSSGCAAMDTVVHTLKSGDHVLCMDDVYGGTNRFLQQVSSRFGISFDFVDMTDVDNVRRGLTDATALVWVETPTNPTMKVVDIAAVVELARAATSKPLVLVDNTFATPIFQRPLTFGADIVLHSITKYINGHTDVTMGCLMTDSAELDERYKFIAKSIGNVPSPLDCYMTMRGVRTLGVRMKQHMVNGLKVARFLAGHAKVRAVLHPGLASHPQYELCRRQMKGFSGMVSFYIAGGLDGAQRFLKALKLIYLAESLGGFESLANHPALMTHGSVPKAQRDALGISDDLIRLSIGIEDGEDLVADLAQALDAV